MISENELIELGFEIDNDYVLGKIYTIIINKYDYIAIEKFNNGFDSVYLSINNDGLVISENKELTKEKLQGLLNFFK